MKLLIDNYPLILLLIIFVCIFYSRRKDVVASASSLMGFLYLKKFQKFSPVVRSGFDLEKRYINRFTLFAGTYILVFSFFSLHFFGQTPFNYRFSMKFFEPKRGFDILYKIKEDIPKSASVSVPSDIGVLLCEREKVYLFPTVKDAAYIVFDLNHRDADDYWDLNQVVNVLNTGKYGIFKKRGRFIILKKGAPLNGVDRLIKAIRKRIN